MKRTRRGINHTCYRGLDIWPDGDVLEALWEGQRRAVDCLRPALPAIAAAARATAERLGRQGRLIFVGAGSAGRLAGIEAMELGPTFGFPDSADHLADGRRRDMSPGGHGGVEDDGADAERRMAALAPRAGDVVIAVAASGSTAFTLAAARAGAGAARLPSASPIIPIRLCSTRAITRSCWTAGPRSSTAPPAWAPARRRRRRSIC